MRITGWIRGNNLTVRGYYDTDGGKGKPNDEAWDTKKKQVALGLGMTQDLYLTMQRHE